MEKNARWDDTSLLPERGLALSPAVDANLRDRIRSLLVSRNQRHPPKTPCPSPDLNFVRRESVENRPDNRPIPTKTYKFNPAQAEAHSIKLEKASSDMGATRFDGPAGQIEDTNSNIHARRPSQPDVQSSRKFSGDWQWSTPTSGLNQRAYGDILGREAFIPSPMDRKRSSASGKSTGSRIPRFHLRTVPPAKDGNKILRPAPLHVPGSYQSEVDVKRDRELKTISPPLQDTSEVLDDEILAVPYHAGITNEHSHQAAVDALKDVVKHDHPVDQVAPKIHSTPSHENIKPNAEVIKEELLKQESPTKQALPSQAPDTVLQSAGDLENPGSEEAEAPVFVIGDDHGNVFELSDRLTTQHEDPGPGEQASLLSGRQISDLLAELPPMRQGALKNSISHCPIRTAAAALQESTSKENSKSTTAESLHSVALDGDEGDQPEATEIVAPEVIEFNDEATSPLIPDTRRSSQATRRFSSVSRAMSMLSEISARSGFKTSSHRSSPRYEKIGSSNLTARPSSRSGRNALETSAVREGYKAPSDDNQHDGSNAKDERTNFQSQQTNGEGFAKVITDLESVLNEALSIAGNVASRDHRATRPRSSSAQHREHSRADSDASTDDSDYLSSLSGGADEEDNDTTLSRHMPNDGQEHLMAKQHKNDTVHRTHFTEPGDSNAHPGQRSIASTLPIPDDHEARLKRQSTHRDLLGTSRTPSKVFNPPQGPLHRQSSTSMDWAVIRMPSNPSKLRLEMKPPPPAPQMPPTAQAPAKEQRSFHVRDHGDSEDTMTRTQIRDYLNSHQRPPIHPRLSSRRLKGKAVRGRVPKREELNLPEEKTEDDEDEECECVPYVADFETSGLNYHPVFQATMAGEPTHAPRQGPHPFHPPQDTLTPLRDDEQKREASRHDEPPPVTNTYSLEGRHHFSIREPRGFSLSRSHRRSPIARDWSASRKRYTATVVCITTAFMGLIIGIYAGEVPAIQYAIADEHHYTILGNVFFFIGLAITTALFYPLPLLHGRKPYTLAALAILLPLQFPQALAINMNRSPYVATYRVGLLVPRVFAGIVMGFANINFITTLLDLYGASLQSSNPHQETVNQNDVRRHGGGMGVWLSIWTWCAIGSLGLGFLIGAGIISGLDVSWGFWILIILNAAVLVLNIVSPEVRRSAYRRSMAEVRSGGDVSRRVARGEIKMHLESTGPIWWGEEVFAGHVLAIRMLKQPGFAVLALYQGWIYGQVVLVIVVSHAWSNARLPSSRSISYSGPSCPSTTASTLSMSGWLWVSFPSVLFWRCPSKRHPCSAAQDITLNGRTA